MSGRTPQKRIRWRKTCRETLFEAGVGVSGETMALADLAARVVKKARSVHGTGGALKGMSDDMVRAVVTGKASASRHLTVRGEGAAAVVGVKRAMARRARRAAKRAAKAA